jgi:hypothetical protein
MKYIYTLPNCRKSRELKRKLGMQGIAYEERGVFRFDPKFHPRDKVDAMAMTVYVNQFKTTPVEVDHNGA